MKQEIIDGLMELDACPPAIDWAKSKRTIQSAWNTCERGDWMLWLIGKTTLGEPWSDERKPLVLAVCKCARLALKYIPKEENRSRIAIKTAEAWTRGEATKEDVKKAAAYAAYAAYAVDAADAAAHAAADAAAYAAVYAADAAAHAADAAAHAAREKTFKKCANIARKYYPNPPELINKEK